MADRKAAAAERRERAAAEERARAERAQAQQQRVLQLRTAGVQYPDIARVTGLAADDAAEAGRRLLAERAAQLEPAALVDMLELERLDAMEQRTQAVLQQAAQVVGGRITDPSLVLRSVDRLLLISERRALIQPSRPVAGPMEQAVATALATYPERVRADPGAAAALKLARTMDTGVPAADLIGITRELRVTLRLLAGMAPAESATSTVDDLRERRKARLAQASSQ